jgi:hypothetical protein
MSYPKVADCGGGVKWGTVDSVVETRTSRELPSFITSLAFASGLHVCQEVLRRFIRARLEHLPQEDLG